MRIERPQVLGHQTIKLSDRWLLALGKCMSCSVMCCTRLLLVPGPDSTALLSLLTRPTPGAVRRTLHRGATVFQRTHCIWQVNEDPVELVRQGGKLTRLVIT